MLDHIGIAVSDFEQFQALLRSRTGAAGYRPGDGSVTRNRPVTSPPPAMVQTASPISGSAAASRLATRISPSSPIPRQVDAFTSCVGAGGRNGAPGLRPHYHKDITAPSCWTRRPQYRGRMPSRGMRTTSAAGGVAWWPNCRRLPRCQGICAPHGCNYWLRKGYDKVRR